MCLGTSKALDRARLATRMVWRAAPWCARDDDLRYAWLNRVSVCGRLAHPVPIQRWEVVDSELID